MKTDRLNDAPNTNSQQDKTMFFFKRLLSPLNILLASTLFLGLAQAQLSTKQTTSTPSTYTVQPGDTLTIIADRLHMPAWQWQQYWRANSQLTHQSTIYPGDIVSLKTTPNGQTYLDIKPGAGIVKLSPQMRITAAHTAVPTIPADDLRPFLKAIRVIAQARYQRLPRVLKPVGDKLIAGTGDELYLSHFTPAHKTHPHYLLVRQDKLLKDPDTKKILGYEAHQIGEVTLIRAGNPAIFRVTEASEEIKRGDRLLTENTPAPLHLYFFPHPPGKLINGRILSVIGGVSVISQYDVVGINRGKQAGVKLGDVFGIYKTFKKITDPSKKNWLGLSSNTLKVPEKEIGNLMIFKNFKQVSFGVVLHAKQAIKVNDVVSNPTHA